MSVWVYRVDARVVFHTSDGMRERSTVRLFVAEGRRLAVTAALRVADRALRRDIDHPPDNEGGHTLGSVYLDRTSINGVGENGEVEPTMGMNLNFVVEPVHLDWKMDYPGTLEQYANAAAKP